jgi:hypothetical protein
VSPSNQPVASAVAQRPSIVTGPVNRTERTTNNLLRRYSAGRFFGFSQAKALSLGNDRSVVSRETGKRLGAAAGVEVIAT